MQQKQNIEIHFKSKIDPEYRDTLERIFFFNGNQKKYAARITQSVSEYSKPVIAQQDGKIALKFEDKKMGQTLHIFDGDYPGSNLIGVLMYVRDSQKRITIVHLALHERCKKIFCVDGVNVASVVIKKLFSIFKQIKGVERIRIYYLNKELNLYSRSKILSNGSNEMVKNQNDSN